MKLASCVKVAQGVRYMSFRENVSKGSRDSAQKVQCSTRKVPLIIYRSQ